MWCSMSGVHYILTTSGLWIAIRSFHLGMAFSANDMVRLRNDLLGNYSVGVLPLKNQSKSLPVNMSFFLIMIHNLNMKNQVLTASGWLKFEWRDEFLQWSPDQYGGIDELILFQKDVWLPDIFVENTAQHYRELGNSQMLISVKDTGMVHWEPGIITETSCAVNIGKYPFDTQICDIRFLTWMHTNKTLTVGPERDQINLDALLPNGEWDITQTEANVYRYPSTYRNNTDHTGVTFRVHLRRKRFFYVLNTIIPVVMLSCLNVLVFILPSDCGERMALAVTVLLAFTVYLGIISDNIPKTSESLSLLAIYLTSLLALSTASVVCAGIVLNIHYRDPSHPVPKVLKWMFSSAAVRTTDEPLKPSTYSADTQRASISYWERRPVFWDTRRPSFKARRLTFRENRRCSRDYHPTEPSDDKDEVKGDTEKSLYVSTKPTHSSRYHVTCSETRERLASRPESLHESTDGDQNESVCDADDVTNGNGGVNDSSASRTNKCKLSRRETHPNYNHTVKKKVSYEDLPFVERGVPVNNYRPTPPETYEMDRSPSIRQYRSLDKLKRNHADDANHVRPGAVSAEVRSLLNEQKEAEKAKECEITWHDIGNSLDRWLFWFFFLVTNTVTVVILVLFVRNDA